MFLPTVVLKKKKGYTTVAGVCRTNTGPPGKLVLLAITCYYLYLGGLFKAIEKNKLR